MLRHKFIIIFLIAIFLFSGSNVTSAEGNLGFFESIKKIFSTETETLEISGNGKINFKMLENVSNEELTQQITDYIENHPEERPKFINQMLILGMSNKNIKDILSKRTDDIVSSVRWRNSIPLIGEYLGQNYLDDTYKKIDDEIKKFVLESINNEKYIKRAVEKYKGNLQVVDFFLKNNIVGENINIETYNAEVKIALLQYRKAQAYINNHRLWEVHGSYQIGTPNAIDIALAIIDELTYDPNAFKDKIDEEKYNSALNSVEKICSALWLDKIPENATESSIEKYYVSLIPRHIFAYIVEENYFPKNFDDVYIGGMSKDAGEKMDALLNGEWISLNNGENIMIKTNPKNIEQNERYMEVNYIYFCDKNNIFALFNYRDKNDNLNKCLITQANYSNFGKSNENIILFYKNPKTFNVKEFNRYATDLKFVETYRINNISGADEVLMKKI